MAVFGLGRAIFLYVNHERVESISYTLVFCPLNAKDVFTILTFLHCTHAYSKLIVVDGDMQLKWLLEFLQYCCLDKGSYRPTTLAIDMIRWSALFSCAICFLWQQIRVKATSEVSIYSACSLINFHPITQSHLYLFTFQYSIRNLNCSNHLCLYWKCTGPSLPQVNQLHCLACKL